MFAIPCEDAREQARREASHYFRDLTVPLHRAITDIRLVDPLLHAKQALVLGFVHEVVPDDKLQERARDVSTQLA